MALARLSERAVHSWIKEFARAGKCRPTRSRGRNWTHFPEAAFYLRQGRPLNTASSSGSSLNTLSLSYFRSLRIHAYTRIMFIYTQRSRFAQAHSMHHWFLTTILPAYLTTHLFTPASAWPYVVLQDFTETTFAPASLRLLFQNFAVRILFRIA